MICHPVWNPTSKVLAAALLSVIFGAALPASAAQDGLVAELQVASAQGQDMTMKVSVAGDNVRIDMSAPQGEVSSIWTEAGMLMILHSQRMYMEFSRQMMDSMAGMMGQMGGKTDTEAPELDASQVTFARTGKTETIGSFDAFEVRATGAGDGDTAYLWMSPDAAVGLFDVLARMSAPLQSANMPFMRGGGNPMAKMKQYEQYARAQGLPAGKVIRVMGEDGGSMTLASVVEGPLGAETWQAPADYTKRSMPGMPQ